MLTSFTRALFAVILLASWSPSSTTAAGGGPAAGLDAGGDAPGFVIVQIDGLSEPVLHLALESGAMPFVQGLVAGGSHTIGSWRTTAATATTVRQAGLLHGKWRDIPAFRWWDHETGQLASAEAEVAQAPIGDEICVTSAVEGAVGEVCARRDRFGALWTTELTDTADDGRRVEARISLDVAEAPDETRAVENDQGEALTMRSSDRFSPRVGSALGDVSLETCVIVRFGRDRCRTESATLPQLTAQGTPAQRQRLEELVFEMPLQEFVAEHAKAGHSGIDASFDWSSDGCSAGPFRELMEERLKGACLRHDFAYRNFGQLFLDPTDDVRRRVDERLAADATDLGQGSLAGGLRDALRRFGAPVFFGDDLAALWDVPDFIVSRLGLDTEEAAPD